MATRFVKTALLLLLVGTSTSALNAQRGQASASCDKACLQGIADAYLAALVAHDPSKAPIAPNAKFTEQAQPMAIGEGQLWTLTTEGPTTFKIPVADPVVGQIGLIVMLKAALPPAPPRGRAQQGNASLGDRGERSWPPIPRTISAAPRR